MSAPAGSPIPERIRPEMFRTSRRLDQLVRLLRPLPRWLGESLLAAMAVTEGLVRPARFRRARAWAAAQPETARPPWRLALALLANHGRFCGQEAFLGVSSWETVRRDVVVEGAEHLRAARDGAILLGFHLGPPRTWVRLRALGYPVRLAGRIEASTREPQWEAVLDAQDSVRLPSGAARERLPGLVQIREFLRSGALVYLTADGPFGREAFRFDLPGGPLVVRTGWLALRRVTHGATLPVLTHADGRRHVIVVHPPLPLPAGDLERDAAACRQALTPLIEAFVRRFPTQCRYLALPPWSTTPTLTPEHGSAALDRPVHRS